MRFAACTITTKKKSSGKKVAIIGAGPAGLKAAGFLICQGHEVTVYDKLPEPGGLLIFGIPDWRFPKEPIRKGISELRDLGVKFICNTEVGKDVHISELKDAFDAVIIATGTWKERRLNIPGENLKGVYNALDFLVKLALARDGYISWEPDIGDKAVVIGGGNSAMDVARTLIRLGVKTMVVYRRSREYMPALQHEVDRAIKEGVEFIFLASPKKILGENGRVSAVEFIRNKLGELDSSGRPRPVPIPNSEFLVECDSIFEAIGEIPTPPESITSIGVKLDRRGRIITDEKGMTSVEGVFAAGDVVLGPSEIGKAMRSGLKVAKNVDAYLAE